MSRACSAKHFRVMLKIQFTFILKKRDIKNMCKMTGPNFISLTKMCVNAISKVDKKISHYFYVKSNFNN